MLIRPRVVEPDFVSFVPVVARTCFVMLLFAGTLAAQARISFEQAMPAINAVGPSLPADLRGRAPQDLTSLWPAWVERHDREVRSRLARGDEDSLVNFWLYGTSFTSQAPAVARDSSTSAGDIEDLARRRLDDFLDNVTRPGANERLQFSRRVLAARNLDLSTSSSRDRARRFMLDARRRMMDEFAASDRALTSVTPADAGARAAANASIFRERGLSSDTSILSDYGVATALQAIRDQGLLRAGAVARVAIVGPGLDFTNKADGYDFYPQQTIQPFALVDTLRRIGLAAPSLRLTTFDINSRVNEHIKTASERATSASGYVLTLPLDGDEAWTDDLLTYWKTFGRTIGEEIAAARVPVAAGKVLVRSVRVRPEIVRSIAPRDLNIVLARLPLATDDRFDVIVATNVLVYYSVFEQALAMSNIASMLRSGGVFLTNNAVFPTPPMKPGAAYLKVEHTARRYDELFWYQRE